MSYEEALHQQRLRSRAGGRDWLLFSCPPTITLGRRTEPQDILVPEETLTRLGVKRLEVDRGGKATYHGPEQIIGFPVGTLTDHVGDPRAVKRFVENLELKLKGFLTHQLKIHQPQLKVMDHRDPSGAGVWVQDSLGKAKIAALGLKFNRDSICHGFALNVSPVASRFEVLNPCGLVGARVASLMAAPATSAEFNELSRTLKNHLQAD